MSTTFQISTPIYWGFQYEIQNSLLEFMEDDDIIKEVKEAMKFFFKSYNLLELYEGVDKLNLHKDGVYLCDHKH